MATLTAEATLGTALSVECGHHVATARTQTTHRTEFRKPVAVKRNSKTAESQTIQNTFDNTASSGMGAWESVLDYDQYNLDVTDKQSITLVGDAFIDDGNILPSTISDSGRIGLVFDFTEYADCTPAVTVNNIVVKYTADGEGTLEVRTSTDDTTVDINQQLYVEATYVADDYIDETITQDYTTSLSSYTIDNGFVTVWFKGAGITISNITARISASGRAKASLTPLIKSVFTTFNDTIEVETANIAGFYERDTTLTFDNIDLSSWPSTLQNDAFKVNSLVNFAGVLDTGATAYNGYVNYLPPAPSSLKTISTTRAQATEDRNPGFVDDEITPTTQFQVFDNNPNSINANSWRIGAFARGFVEFNDHIFLPCVNRVISEDAPLEQFNALTISVWWYGANIPSTFFMADVPDASYNVSTTFGDRSVKLTHTDSNNLYNKFEFSYPTGGGAPRSESLIQSNFFGQSARNTLTANFLLNQYINTDSWNNLLISFVPHTSLEYSEILEGINHPLTMKAYLNGNAANSISGLNTPELGSLPVTQSLANDMYIIANPDISDFSGSFRSEFESVNTILNAKYRGDGTSNNLGSTEDTTNAYYFIDNQYIDLDVQSNREIFRNLDGTPTTAPQINGQTPKVFISGNHKTINNNGTLPLTKFNLVQTNIATGTVDTIVGGAPTARIITKENGVKWNRDVFEADATLPTVIYNRITSETLQSIKQLELNKLAVDLAHVYEAQGTFTSGFLKSKVLFDLNLVAGNINLNTAVTTSQDVKMIRGAKPTLVSNFDFDTTTGKIHLFRFNPLAFNTAFTSTQSGSRLITGTIESSEIYVDDDYVVEGYYDKEGGLFGKFTLSQPTISYQITAPAITLNTAFTTQQTGRKRISDANTITTPITTTFNTFGRIHIFRFDDKTLSAEFGTTATGKIFRFDPVTLASAFDIDVVGGITNIRSGAITCDTAFTIAVDGGVELSSGLVALNTAFTTTQSGSMLRLDGDAITLDTSFNIRSVRGYVIIANAKTLNTSLSLNETGKIHIFTFAPHTFATNLALNETGKIHVFTFTPHTFDTAFTFDTTTGTGKKIHLFRFVPRTFDISSAFNPNTGRIHLFNLPAIDLATPFTANFRGGIRQEAQPTLDTNITVDVFAPVPLAPITLDTSLTLSQPTVEIAKQSNKVFAPTQNRTRIARPHPRTVEAERLETVTSSGVDEWQDVAQWLDFDDFTSRHSISHRITAAQNRTVEAKVSTRTMLVTQADRDELADTLTATYTVNADTRSYVVEHQHSYNVHSHDRQYIIPKTHINTHYHRLVTADTETRVVLAERLT